jgi:hypothetical protein
MIDSEGLLTPTFAPPDSFDAVSDYLESFSDWGLSTFQKLLQSCSPPVAAAVNKPRYPITLFAPSDQVCSHTRTA